MDRVQADLELATLHIKQLEKRVAQQRTKIVRMRADGLSTRPEEEQLVALSRALQLVKQRLADMTAPISFLKSRS